MIVKKPWGTYEVLLDEPTYKVKRIVVHPYERFSLQYHKHREEHWVIVEGDGIVQVNEKIINSCQVSFKGPFKKYVTQKRLGFDDLPTYLTIDLLLRNNRIF